jgi:hypothetical protein
VISKPGLNAARWIKLSGNPSMGIYLPSGKPTEVAENNEARKRYEHKNEMQRCRSLGVQ